MTLTNVLLTEVYDELVEMRRACGEAHMKSILAVGELVTLTNVLRASLVAMMAGSDFIKTSTGTSHEMIIEIL